MSAIQEIEKQINMEIKPVDQNLIPVFSGDKTTLRSYVTACEYLIEEFLNPHPDNARMNKRLLMIFLGKLEGKAREAVDANKVPITWPELKEILVHSFGDKRSEDVLVHDLNSVIPNRNENVQDYASKIKATLYTLLSKINLTENNLDIRHMKISQYNQLALRTFLFGLDLINDKIGMEVKLRQPGDIETAEGYAIEIENYNLQKKRYLETCRRPINPFFSQPMSQSSSSKTPQITRPIPRPTQQLQQRSPQQPHFQQNYQPQRFIPPAQQRYLTPRFAPSPGQIQQRTPARPTPMDVDTTAIKRAASSMLRPAKRPWPNNNMIGNPDETREECATNAENSQMDGCDNTQFEENNAEQYQEDFYDDYEEENNTLNFMVVRRRDSPT